METIEINLNAVVTVRLTNYGRQIYLKSIAQEILDSSQPPVSIAVARELVIKGLEDQMTFPLHEIMQIFGSSMYVGNPLIPFVDNEILLKSTDFNLKETQ